MKLKLATSSLRWLFHHRNEWKVLVKWAKVSSATMMLSEGFVPTLENDERSECKPDRAQPVRKGTA